MPKRWCIACRKLFDMDSTGTLRCPACQAVATQKRNARAPRASRGYDAAHDRERAKWAPVVAAGQAWCMEFDCLMEDRHITPGTPWDLAHNKNRDGWRGPAHQRCNRATNKGGEP